MATPEEVHTAVNAMKPEEAKQFLLKHGHTTIESLIAGVATYPSVDAQISHELGLHSEAAKATAANIASAWHGKRA